MQKYGCSPIGKPLKKGSGKQKLSRAFLIIYLIAIGGALPLWLVQSARLFSSFVSGRRCKLGIFWRNHGNPSIAANRTHTRRQSHHGTDSKDRTGKSLLLLQEISYQPGQTVRKSRAQSRHYNLSLFVLDKGEEISAYVSNGDAMVLGLDGDGRITIDGTEHTVYAGEVIVMPAQKPHAVFAKEAFKCCSLFCFQRRCQDERPYRTRRVHQLRTLHGNLSGGIPHGQRWIGGGLCSAHGGRHGPHKGSGRKLSCSGH